MENDKSPAVSGCIHISDNGFASFTVHEWPIIPSIPHLPARGLVIRERNDGEVTVRITTAYPDN